jgi:class 3 adenylate cyclase/CHASE2 domain-containing sensor protein
LSCSGFFVSYSRVKPRPHKRILLPIAAAVIGLTALLRIAHPDLLDRVENATYDQRVRAALKFHPVVAENLGFVFIDEDSIRAVRSGELGYKHGLYWPRHVYGRAVEELAAQGASAVAFDVVFGELRPDHPLAQTADGQLLESDDYLALQMRTAGNVILAVTPDVTLPSLFRTNAAALGDISTEKDSDGILRRVRAFQIYRHWHPIFLQVQSDPALGVDLRRARLEPHKLILPRSAGEDVTVPLDDDGNFAVSDFVGESLPPGLPAKAKPFTEERIWHMGIVVAARGLGLDLENAEVDLDAGRIILRGASGVERVLPVDKNGCFLIDWCLPPSDHRLLLQPIHALLAANRARLQHREPPSTNDWSGKLAIVGSAVAGGNDLTDRGATPLAADTLLVSKHWNVANSVLTGRFIRRLELSEELLLILVLGTISALVTWRLRAMVASAAVAVLALVFIAACFGIYIRWRLWIPITLPCVGSLLATHASLITCRLVYEQTERRRVRSVFSKIVSPYVVNELLKSEKLSLGGAHREVSVFFADVRGFTEFTEASHHTAAQFVRERGLSGAEAADHLDRQARETLATVNLYLARVADRVKQHEGTLDKYIGDCVMAFWGAPTPNRSHAASCVRAAIDAQRAVHGLNEQRTIENRRIELENNSRAAAGLPPIAPLPILSLGTGINTGLATVGLMGSDDHVLNYTVFGREVNLASRLEGVSGRGRIIISETTHHHLRRDDPTLAETCTKLPPVEVKGIREAVPIYEVPWLPSVTPALKASGNGV